MQAYGFLPAVSDPYGPGDDIPAGEHPVQELRLQPGGRILQEYRERLRLLIFPGEGRRKAIQAIGALSDLMA